MATPETCSVELDPFAPSFDGDLDVVENEEHQLVEAEVRELSAYTFDSDEKTIVGIGGSASSVDSSAAGHFDISDRTLVGIGPAERAKREEREESADVAELATHELQAEPEPTPESGPIPYSEPPGPFIASDADDDVPDRLPMQKGDPWVLAVSAALVAAGAFALLRGVVPHTSARHLHAAAAVIAPPRTVEEAPTRDVGFETSAPEASAVESRATEPSEASQLVAPPATTPLEKFGELAPPRAKKKPARSEPLGALDVTSNAPAGLVVDGRPLGKAPRVIQVPSGPHTVLFIHPERGRMSVTVNVKAGRTTSASAAF